MVSLYARIQRLALISALLGPQLAYSAGIQGRVYDVMNTTYLEGVTVTLVETGDSLTSERSGRFTFSGLEPGTYTVELSAVGYRRARQTVVLDEEASIAEVVIRVNDEDVYDLEEFVVSGALVGAAKALNQQRTAGNLQSIVSADALGQFVDRNAAEALQRLPGVTVDDSQGEGKFLIIRGANPAWNTVTIDGVELATPEENGRSIGLNIITVDQLESIEVIKSWLPNQKGGVVGGNVNMKTRSALDRGERFGSIEAGIGLYDIADNKESWRGSVTFGDVFKLGKRLLAFQISVNQSLDNRGSDTLSLGWQVMTDYPLLQAPKGLIVDTTNMDDYRIRRERIGLSTKLELLLAPGHELNFSVSFNRFDDVETLQSASMEAPLTAVQYRGRQRLTTALALELGLNPSDPAVLARINAQQVANARLTFAESVRLGDAVFNPDTNTFEYSSNWEASIGRVFQHSETRDEITTYQLGGSHYFTPAFKLEWRGYSTEADKATGQLGIRFGGRGLNVIPTVGASVADTRLVPLGDQNSFFLDPASFYIDRNAGTLSDLRDFSTDQRVGGDLDLSLSHSFGKVTTLTKMGASYDAREKSYLRDYTRRSGEKTLDPVRYPLSEIRLNSSDFYAGQQDEFLYGYGNYQFGPQFDDARMVAFLRDPLAYGVDFGTPKYDDVTFAVSNAVLRNYSAEENIAGLYWMQTINIEEWSFIFGVRWEETENTFTNNQINTRSETGAFIRPSMWVVRPLTDYAQPVTVQRKYAHYLPAFHIKKTLPWEIILRASVTQTIFRPLFTDLVPREIPNVTAGGLFGFTVSKPNLDLRAMESTNYDLSLQKYFERVGYINVSAFYKDLDGAIYSERREVPPGEETQVFSSKYTSLGRNTDTYILTQMRNAGKGYLYGIEFAYDRDLTFLGEWANGLGFNYNVAFMDSQVELVTAERLGEAVPLFRQPDTTMNFSLYYENKRVFARLSYNLRGSFLKSVRGGVTVKELTDPAGANLPANTLDTFEDAYGRWDLNMRWKVTRRFQIFAEITNLTNAALKEYQGTRDRPVQIRYTGPIYFIGAKWNL
jgi:TonB-dependent receptor